MEIPSYLPQNVHRALINQCPEFQDSLNTILEYYLEMALEEPDIGSNAATDLGYHHIFHQPDGDMVQHTQHAMALALML